MSDLRPSLDPVFSLFGVDATIPYPTGVAGPLTVRAVPLSYRPTDVPLGTDVRDPQYRIVFAFRRTDVETLPRGTVIEAPEREGGAVVTWRVETLAHIDAEELRVVVARP